jgi:hypothetical protein
VHFSGWDSWTVQQRLTAIQLFIVKTENKFGLMAKWLNDFALKWSVLDPHIEDHQETIHALFDKAHDQIESGDLGLVYVGRLMEGEMPSNLEEWRGLHLQALQSMEKLCRATVALQTKFDIAIQEFNSIVSL